MYDALVAEEVGNLERVADVQELNRPEGFQRRMMNIEGRHVVGLGQQRSQRCSHRPQSSDGDLSFPFHAMLLWSDPSLLSALASIIDSTIEPVRALLSAPAVPVVEGGGLGSELAAQVGVGQQLP